VLALIDWEDLAGAKVVLLCDLINVTKFNRLKFN